MLHLTGSSSSIAAVLSPKVKSVLLYEKILLLRSR